MPGGQAGAGVRAGADADAVGAGAEETSGTGTGTFTGAADVTGAATGGDGSAEQPNATPKPHTQLPTANCQLLTLHGRIQNKMRQHTLQPAGANALHA